MTKLEDWLVRACDALRLPIDLGYAARLGDDVEVRSVARIQGVSDRGGMLVFRSYDDVRNFGDGLMRAGYGYTVLDEPRADESFDLNSFAEMFRDWGWRG